MDQFQDQIEKALDELADDRIDQGIDLWETTFSQAEPYLSTEDGLMLKQEYAIILQHVGAIEKARKVDAWIEEALEKDEEEGNEEVSSHFRNKLLENVARRWNLPVQPAEENDVDDNIADSKNGGLESDAITTVLELQPVVEQPLQRAQRGQSLTIPERPAELGNQSVEKPNHSMVSEERTAKVESSSHLSPARPTLQGADLSSEYVIFPRVKCVQKSNVELTVKPKHSGGISSWKTRRIISCTAKTPSSLERGLMANRMRL